MLSCLADLSYLSYLGAPATSWAPTRRIARERVETFRATAQLHRLSGEYRRAAEWWRRALDEAERLDALPELARTCSMLADCAGAEGNANPIVLDRRADQWRAKASEYQQRLLANEASKGNDGSGPLAAAERSSA